MMSSYATKLSAYRWADASIDEIYVNYERTVLRFTESSGRSVALMCEAHISVRWEEHWDENIVESVTIRQDTSEVRRALTAVQRRYGSRPSPGGGIRQMAGPWFEIRVQLIDGTSIVVVAQSINFDPPDG